MTSFIEIAQIFTGQATDIDDIITNITGTLIGYLIAYGFTGVFTGRIVKNSKKERLLHNMCICSTYYVLPSTIYFIFVMGKCSVNLYLSTCPLREEKSFSQRAFLYIRIFANHKIKPKLHIL